MQLLASEFMKKYQLNVTESKKAIVKLRSECERIVQVLSSTASTMASIESLMEGTFKRTWDSARPLATRLGSIHQQKACSMSMACGGDFLKVLTVTGASSTIGISEDFHSAWLPLFPALNMYNEATRTTIGRHWMAATRNSFRYIAA